MKRSKKTFVAGVFVGLALFLAAPLAGEGSRIVWVDAAAVAFVDSEGAARHGAIRDAAPGEAGDPVADPIPPPLAVRPDLTTNPCSWIPGGSFRDANGWYHAMTPEGVNGRASVCQWNGPPPVVPCDQDTAPRQQNGYTCTRGSGGGFVWWPAVR